MFYAAELLSLKSKTEISVLYYLSTANSHKKLAKKQILEMDIPLIIEKITSPEIPFSLRLYSHLLYGISKIWVLKLNFCIKEVPVAPARKRIAVKQDSPNLVIEERFVDHISDSDNSIGKTRLSSNIDIVSFGGYDYDIDCIENNENQSKPIKKLKVDLNTLIELKINTNKIVTTPKDNEFEYKSRIDCYAIDYFKKTVAEQHLQGKEVVAIEEDFNYEVSFEDPRNSNSTVLSIHKSDSNQNTETANMAEWFYSILVRASKGEIVVFQRAPFEELEIL